MTIRALATRRSWSEPRRSSGLVVTRYGKPAALILPIDFRFASDVLLVARVIHRRDLERPSAPVLTNAFFADRPHSETAQVMC
jgi:hypothetical protein